MVIHLFECPDNERAFWQERFAGHEVRFSAEPLTEPGQAAPDVEAVAVFVQSMVHAEVIGSLQALRFVAARSTGFNHIDLAAAAARGIAVSNVPSYGENTVAEHAFALLLAISTRTIEGVARTRGGSFSPDGLTGFDLKGKVAGVVGTGRIGRHFIEMATGFGMSVVAYDLFPNQALADELGFAYVEIDELVAQSDVISLHAPSTPETRHIISRERLQAAKSTLTLINTARGDLVDTEALADILAERPDMAAGLDVLEDESAGLDSPVAKRLLALPNALITPHMAFNSREGVARIRDTSAENIESFLAGTPKNLAPVAA